MIAPKKNRVLIVDDSILFRTTLEKKLNEDPYLEVVGTASDAIEALEKVESLKPDVLTLDVEMPKVSGIEFLKKLMPLYPTPVVVVSGAPVTTLDALDAGAVDFVKKPLIQSPADLDNFVRELIVKLKIGSIANVGQKKAPQPPKPQGQPTLLRPIDNMVIAIGASTGGTEAILEVVKDLPTTTPGIVIVQHMPAVFTRMYAERLDKHCKMRVKEAQDGDRVERGKIIIAAGEFHLRLARNAQGYYVTSKPGEKVSGHCPSVDVLFESVADTAKNRSLGIILTGMGADGSKGLLKMRKAGAYTIGQNQQSCVVYGMPMVAFNIGGVVKQLPLDQISLEITRYLNSISR
ncbi:MAG: chemotaxis response regulator protein-glutamate methylesterase [Oscillospiraceae bacterium]|nr:chemotaxis response regulator protein-glutamate methylesterase [Oscillospiraceae bacterium]